MTSQHHGVNDGTGQMNLHKHREPIVLLERLRHYPEQLQASSSDTSQEYSISKIKKVATALKHNMCLRPKKKFTKFVKRLREKNIIIKSKREPKVNKDASNLEAIDSCNEDDKPLMYLAKEEKNNKTVNKTCSNTNKDGLTKQSIVYTRSHGRTTESREYEQEVPKGPGRRHRSRSILKTDSVKRQRLGTRSSRRSVASASESDNEELQENDESGCTSSPKKTDDTNKNGLPTQRLTSRSLDDASKSRQEEPRNGQPHSNSLLQNTDKIRNSGEKEKPQKTSSQPSTPNKKLTAITDSDANTKPTTSTDDTVSTSEDDHNNEPSTAEKYLNAPLISRRSRTVHIPLDKMSKTNQDKRNITKKQISSAIEQSDSIDTTSKIKKHQINCPSKNYPSMKDVVYADPKDLVNRCEQCDYCAFVDKVQCVSNMFKIQYCRKIIKLKIYGFDAEDEETEKSESNISRTKKRQGNEPNTDCDKQTCYLIYDKDSDHVVEVKRTLCANQVAHIESANIVPKTSNTKIMTVTALDRDYLLDDIINFVLSEKPKTKVETPSHSVNGAKSVSAQKPTNAYKVNGDHNGTEQKSSAIPKPVPNARRTDAPIFFPNEQEFKDPIAYFTKIMPFAAKYGLCKVVAPKNFKPKCMLDDEVRFEVTNQYISRLYKRWGPASRELCAIKAYLASQSVIFSRPPLLEGVEVNLPKLYYLVQTLGGLKEVIEKKRWTKVAEEMNLSKTPKIEVKLDQIYVKYILPYDTMSDDERTDLMKAVDNHWSKKHKKMLQRAMKPLHRQKRLLDESESSEEDIDEDVYVSGALAEAEDCISNGRQMNLLTFKKVASKCKEMYIPNSNQNTQIEIEQTYWKMVLLAQDHICVNNASIDTGEEGYGFTKDQRDSYGKHPWNLKVLSQNSGNVLRFLGPVLGVTVPTLHLGMVFSTSCWHRDPHGLPWIEYMHTGPGKIWYGIPDEQSDNFRRAVEQLCPTSCQNKSIWLPSDITMIPPDLLLLNNVSISRAVQEPGQFILVFPKAYSCSIATGYTVSESVYFATNSWLETIDQVFQEVRQSCEPTMFSLEHLLVSAARDLRAPTEVLKLVHVLLGKIIREELKNRNALAAYKILNYNPQQNRLTRKRPAGAWNVRDQDECEICQATLYLSKVRGLTDKKRSVCLQHALQLLDTEKNKECDLTGVELELFFSDAELERIMTKIKARI
ncbi:Protein Jumonji [Papilio xuthus]|uniref:Protein Jumonji n=1 Tax=Papilio xuthus TaxID=66420 RepID=A0A194Q000_PAPXU|nr:Protein Jumonji [Papilio xuthus]